MLHKITAEKGKAAGSCICSINADIDQVMPKPKQKYLHAQPVVIHVKMVYQNARQQDLHDSAPSKPNELPKKRKDEMPRLMDDQISAIKQRIFPSIQYKIEANGKKDRRTNPVLPLKFPSIWIAFR